MSDASGAEGAPASEGQPPAGDSGQQQSGQAEPQGDGTDWKAEAQKWERRAKSDAERAKANAAAAAELQKLQREQMSEHEKAIAAARQEGESLAAKALAGQMVSMALRAAAAGRLDDAVVERLSASVNPSIFVKDDNTVDMDAVKDFIDGIVPKQEKPKEEKPADPRFPEIGGQGSKGQADLALNGNAFVQALEAAVGRTD